MSDVQWAPDGKRMFEKLMNAVPEAMRDMVKPQLLQFLAAKASGKPVTSEVVTRMVQEDLPEPQKSVIMQALGIQKPAEKKTEKKEAPPSEGDTVQLKLEDNWEGNSQSMFERMIQEVPEALRDVFRGKLMDILKQKAKGGVFQESHIVEIVNEIVPEPFKSNIIKAFSTIGGVDISAVEKIIEQFPGGQESLMVLLHAIQAQYGYVPEEALRVVSQKRAVFMSTLYRLVSSYQAFRTEAPKKYTVSICNGTGCHINGSGAFLEKLEEKIADNDSQITLEKVRCLGCCDLSPAVMVNGEVYGGPDAQAKISEILGE
jgi:NADH-quinone oxidoreductase subunit E